MQYLEIGYDSFLPQTEFWELDHRSVLDYVNVAFDIAFESNICF